MIEQKEKEFDIFDELERSEKGTQKDNELLEMYNSYPIIVPKKGQIINGTYEGISSDQYVFSVRGMKDDVRVENKPSESKYLSSLEVGQTMDLLITDINSSKDYLIKGSISNLYESKAHQELKDMDNDESVLANIKSLNPAGYEVEVVKDNVTLPGFMPNTLAGINKLHDPESIVGYSMDVMIESYSESEGTYIVSRKKYLNSLIPDAIEKIDYDTPYSGCVTGTTPFGVFVEFNECLTGMIHKDNLREDWQSRIPEIQPGFEIQFYVKDIIEQKGGRYKIILTQIIRETLWDSIKNGQIIDGKVKANKQFGILVNLDQETVGLIHTSEVNKVNRNLDKGDDIKVRVLSVDRNSRKIFLASVD